MNWTQSQKNAIEFKNSDVLVSAAAGSGKTAVLTERVLRAVTDEADPTDIRRMLIVTYTKKAAAELRVKVRKKLEEKLKAEPENENVRRQLTFLPSADICTIHSFYIKLLQKNFAALGLPPKIGIGDDAEFLQIKKTILNELIDSYYEGDVKGEFEIKDPASFFGLFSDGKTDTDLWETLEEYYRKAASFREFLGFYDNCAKEAKDAADDFSNSAYFRCLISFAVRLIVRFRDKILTLCDEYESDDLFEEKYRPVFDDCVELLEREIRTYKTLNYAEAAAHAAAVPATPRFPAVGDENVFKAPSVKLKDSLRPKLFNVLAAMFSFSEAQVKEICEKTAEAYSDLYKFLSAFDRLYTEKKLKIKKLGYDDLERYACRLLCGADGKPTAAAMETGKRYDRIFIDEYQDVNSTQDAVFAAISHNDRFMVGDIKQSIYGFRGAEPGIFAQYRKDAENEENRGKVPDVLFLSDNFRCGKPVVDFTNSLFNKLFGADTEEIPYSKQESLVFSKNADVREDVKVRVHICTGDGDKRENDEKEYIAEEIVKLVETGKKDDGDPIGYGDIAILCRRESGCAAIEKKLKEKGIPVSSASKKGFFNAPEVMLAVSLLTAIDNPLRDIPLVSVMRSPLFGFSTEELALIRKAAEDAPFYEAVEAYAKTENGAKCREFTEKLALYRNKSKRLSLEKFIRYLFGQTAIMTLAFNKKDGGSKEARKANLRKIYDLGRSFESYSFGGLSDFVAYCDDLVKNDKDGVIVPAVEEKGCVTVQTLHKSKGLEYPAVFLYAANAEFKKNGGAAVDRRLGPALKIRLGDDSVKGPIYEAIDRKVKDDGIREEMRLLYVGVTRARKYLYITGKSKDPVTFGGRVSLERITECKSHQDMVCLCAAEGETAFSVCESAVSGTEEQKAAADEETPADLSVDKDFEEKVREELSFEYPHRELSRVPNKVAVSKLYPSLLDEDDTVYDIGPDTEIPILLPGEEDTEKTTASSRGTATHIFMQFCDLRRAEAGVREEAERLIVKGFINKENADLIYEDELQRFFTSDLYRRMNGAKEAGRLFYREFRFNIGLDAADFTTDAEMKKKLANETLLVQGVVDCFFEEEDGTVTVCDYKTDRVGRNGVEDFKARHRLQLTYYKKAIERITKKKVGKLSLYSFCLGEEIPV